jgi:hypothetical protein
MSEDVRECRDSIRELTTATNGKMDRAHSRIDKLLFLAVTTLISSVGGLIMIVFMMVRK